MKKEYLELIGSKATIRYLVDADEYKVSGVAVCVIAFDSENKFLVLKSEKGEVECINISIITSINIKKPKWLNQPNPGGVHYG